MQREQQSLVAAAVAECFHCERRGDRVLIGSPVLLRNRQPLNPEVGALAPEGSRELTRAIARYEALVQLFACESQNTLAQFELLFAPSEVHVDSGFMR